MFVEKVVVPKVVETQLSKTLLIDGNTL